MDLCPGFDDTIDSDNDGIPEGCDICPNDSNNDADADGVCGDIDICPGFDDSADADNNGIPDGCDSLPNEPPQVEAGTGAIIKEFNRDFPFKIDKIIVSLF